MKNLKSKKKDGYEFILLFRSKNMTERIKKIYLHRPIKILQFLTPGKIRKCLR